METLKIEVPSWRGTKDISIPEDIVEEIARMYGYGNIETKLPTFAIIPPDRNDVRMVENKVRKVLSGVSACTETLNYSFVSPQILETLGLDTKLHIELDNPIAKDRPYLRRSLLPNLLELVEKNAHIRDEVKIYEIGKIYLKEEAGPRVSESGNDLLPRQDVMFGIAYTKKDDEKPFFVISEALEQIGRVLGIDLHIDPAVTESSYIHHGRYAKVMAHAVQVGEVFEIHPKTTAQLGIRSRVACAEINLRALSEFVTTNRSYKPLSPYPAVERDIAFVVEKTILHRDIHEILVEAHPLVTTAVLFDVFEGKNVGEGKKSMAYRMTYHSKEKTLETSEIDQAHQVVEKLLKERFKAEIRT